MLRRSSKTSKRIQLAVALLVCLVDAQANMTGNELLAKYRHLMEEPTRAYFSAGAVVNKYLRENPERTHEDADTLINEALALGFPCAR